MKKNIVKNISLAYFLLFSIITKAQEVIIQNGDSWNYYDNGYLNDDWYKTTKFTDWKTGVTPIGYGDRKVITTIYFGEDPEHKQVTKYFSKQISIKNLSKFTGFEFKLQRDDGAVVYINGEELYRDNMPDANITSLTKSTHVVNADEEKTFHKKVFDKSIFKEGLNIISVEVHQYNEYSSDCIFSLEIIGHTDPYILAEVVKNQIDSKTSIEAKMDVLNYNFLLKNTTTQLEIYKKTNQNLVFLLVFLAVLLLISIIIAIYIAFKSKKNEELSNQKIITATNLSLDKEKEMISCSNQLLYYKQYLREIKADLKFAGKENREISNIIRQIDSIIENEDEWDQLKAHFNAVYVGFYDNLIEKQPDLTEAELRHCMFIKLHMQTKEIARILNVDPRSVQTARYRIKKKLDLDEDQDLRTYLISI